MQNCLPVSLIGTAVIMVQVLALSADATAAGFNQIYEREGVSFGVKSNNYASLNLVTVTPGGLDEDIRPVMAEVNGIVTGAEIADLDNSGSPEIYVFVHSVGSGTYGSLAAYAVNDRKSLSQIFLPPLTDNPELSEGYMGHDEFSIVEDRFVRRFPIYREGDPNSEPSGGQRELHYSLRPGEAGWMLHLDHVETIEPE